MLHRNYNCLNFKQKVTCFINFDLNFTVYFFICEISDVRDFAYFAV